MGSPAGVRELRGPCGRGQKLVRVPGPRGACRLALGGPFLRAVLLFPADMEHTVEGGRSAAPCALRPASISEQPCFHKPRQKQDVSQLISLIQVEVSVEAFRGQEDSTVKAFSRSQGLFPVDGVDPNPETTRVTATSRGVQDLPPVDRLWVEPHQVAAVI